MTSVMWFRRDLRLSDHPGLATAAATGEVLPLFVLDPVLLSGAGERRRAALASALHALRGATGGRLVLRSGRPEDVVPAVAAEVGASGVVVTEDFGPYGRRRDDQVEAALAAQGVLLERVGTPYLVPPPTLLSGAGRPYRVFTPFYRAWREHLEGVAPVPVPSLVWASLPSEPLPGATPLPLGLSVSEAAASGALEEFLDRVKGYERRRDVPGAEGTSRLSVQLKYGTVHPRSLLAAVAGLPASDGVESFHRSLAWREFNAMLLHHAPWGAWEPTNPRFASMEVDTDGRAHERFEAWKAGRTGYPLVDAGMRQLEAEGWMHNRVRLLVASFLVKDLHLPWQWGARWFLERLVDADLPSNNHNWQWAAGCGADAAPYFRVFNPVTQAERFDPDGVYVRRYVEELRTWSGDVHRPWTAEEPPKGYPSPVVDHAEERRESLRRLAALPR